jgi:ribokinase
MAIYNFGSIVLDNFYRMPRIPVPGETVRATEVNTGLGGKGANQSIAAKKAGSDVFHIGAIGFDGEHILNNLKKLKINTKHIYISDVKTGHANITIDPKGENAITFFAGANDDQTLERLSLGLESAQPKDICLLQNEVNLVSEAAEIAKSKSMMVIYSAAPFSITHLQSICDFVDLIVVNETEHALLIEEFGSSFNKPLLITKGSRGSSYISATKKINCAAPSVIPVDTTGAGDTYLGYFASYLDQGNALDAAMEIASFASAIQVTRNGTSDAIPSLDKVISFSNASQLETLIFD